MDKIQTPAVPAVAGGGAVRHRCRRFSSARTRRDSHGEEESPLLPLLFLKSRLGRYGSVGGDLCRAGFHMQPDADGAPPRVEYRDFPPPSPRCGLGVAAPIGRCVPSLPLLGNVCGGVVVVEGHPWVGSDARWGGVLLARRVGRCGGGRARTSAG